jgi:hypothetical protein
LKIQCPPFGADAPAAIGCGAIKSGAPMLGTVLRWADWLDDWLKAHLGRPYNTALGIALGLGIGASVNAIDRAFHAKLVSWQTLAILAATVVFQLVLLINQLAQLHDFREETRQRRAARREKRDQARRGEASL